MEECQICKKNSTLLDGIFNNKIIRICRTCSIIEGIPIIKRPSSNQVKQTKKSYSVYERLKRISGLPNFKVQEEREKQQKEIKENYIPNFNEEIKKARERKNLTQKQLADLIAEDQKTIEILERGEYIDNERAIIKLEQFLMIKIRKHTPDIKNLDSLEIKRKNIPLLTIGDLKKLKDKQIEKESEKTRKQQETLEKIRQIIEEKTLEKIQQQKRVGILRQTPEKPAEETQETSKEKPENQLQTTEKQAENSLLGEDIEILEE